MNFQPDFFFFNCTAGTHFTPRNIKERAELRRRRRREEEFENASLTSKQQRVPFLFERRFSTRRERE